LTARKTGYFSGMTPAVDQILAEDVFSGGGPTFSAFA
jgi:hypothetical protein